jgi:hypothetical protein
LGDPLHWHRGLCCPASQRMVAKILPARGSSAVGRIVTLMANDAPNAFIKNWIYCAPCINKRVAIWWRTAAGIPPRNYCGRFLPSVRSRRFAGGRAANTTSFPHQRTAVGLQRIAVETHDNGEYRYVRGSCYATGNGSACEG